MDSNTLAVIAALALLTHAGHTLHTMGAARAKNPASVAASSLIGMAALLLLAFLLGEVVQWTYEDPQSGRVAGPGVFFASPTSFLSIVPLGLLPLSLCIGAAAERARVRGIAIVAVVLSLVVVPLTVAIGWSMISQLDQPRADGSYGSAASLSGVIRAWPAIVAHLAASSGALALSCVIGSRAGKYNRDGSANFIPAHALPTMIGGDLLLFIGIPMLAAAIAGDSAARMVNALLAASSATLAAVVMDLHRHRRIDAAGPWLAAIAGLVAGSLSGPAQPLVAIIGGVVVGFILPLISLKIDLKLRVDEPSGLVLVHLAGAITGAVGATLGAVLETDAHLGEVALLGSIGLSAAVVVALVAGGVSYSVALAVRKLKWLRVEAESEVEGLDLTRHDVNAYPDFQQTLIKSYHLRQ